MTMNWRTVCGGAFLLLVFCVESSLSQGCAATSCPTGSTCEEDSRGQAKCVCSTNTMCTDEYAPVCGSDGITYSNACELQSKACTTNTAITKAHDGECQTGSTCDNARCRSGSSCQMISGQPQCVCKTACTDESKPVCGSDGKTYSNQCELDVTACLTNSDTVTAYDGECQTGITCANVRCRSGSSCEMKSGQPRCVCKTACASESKPVCGSDGKTYSNQCDLDVTACHTKSGTTKAGDGPCETGRKKKLVRRGGRK